MSPGCPSRHEGNSVSHLVVKDGENIIGILTLSDLIRFYTDFFD